MTAESEVYKEVVGIGEKCGSVLSSSQDLPRSGCNGKGDLDNSYVFVTGSDGLSEESVDCKEEEVADVAAEGGVEGKKVDVLNGDVSESVEEVNGGHVEVNGVDLVVNGVGIGSEEERSTEDVIGVVVASVDVHEGQNGKAERGVVPEIKLVEEANGRIESMVGDDLEGVADHGEKLDNVMESYIKQVEEPNGRLESMVGADLEDVADHSEKLDNVTESDINQVEDPNGRPESMVEADLEGVADHSEKLENLMESDIKHVEEPNGRLESIADAQSILEIADHSEKLEKATESETTQVEDSNGRLESIAQADFGIVADHSKKLEKVTESEIKKVEEPNGSIESSVVTEVDEDTHQNGILGNVEVNEVKQVEDPNEMLERSVKAEKREVDHQDESFQDELKSEIKLVEEPNEALESLEGSEPQGVADPNINVAEDEIIQAEDPEKRLDSLEDFESGIIVDPNVNVEEDEIKEAEDPTKRQESSAGAEIEAMMDQSKILECAAETETKEVEDANLRPERSAGAEPEMVPEQKSGVTDTELVDQITYDVSSAVLEDPESQVGNGVFVAEPEENCELNDPSLVINGSAHYDSASKDQNNFVSTGRSEICKGSQDVVDEPAESELQVEASKGENEIILAKELVEAGITEVPPATSKETDSESHPVDNSEGTLEEQANEAFVSDANQKDEAITSIQGELQGELQQVDEAQSVVAGDDRKVETGSVVFEITHEKDIYVSRGEFIVQNDEDPEKHSDTCGMSSEMTKSGTETGPCPPPQSLPASSVHKPEDEIGMPNAKTAGETSLAPVDGPEIQTVKTGPTNHKTLPIGTENDDASSESASLLGLVVSAETGPTSLSENANVEAEESVVEGEVLSNQPAAVDVKLESEVHDSGSASSEEKAGDVAVGLGVKDVVLETEDVEDIGDHLDSSRSSNAENVLHQENNGVPNAEGDSISVVSPEGSKPDMVSRKEMGIPIVTKPFNYVIKVPRYNDDGLKEQIRQAKLQVEEKTKLRDAIQHQIHQIRANGQIHGVDFEYAKGENRNARKLLRLKRMEIDSLQSVINKAKNAISIGDIDTRIYNVEHMIQHETLPLKEEKQLIREIKQLRGLRGELSSNMGTEEEIRQALEQREESEERLKKLRKELELLKGEVLKTEAATMEAGTKYDNEIKKVRELQIQFKAANDVRQEAYARWLSLRKELSEKNKHFFKYRDDAATASNYAFSRDTESLYRLCTDQVEKVMELWNTNDEFRKEYISFNTRSTVWRFGTLDGRSLGPDEEPIVLPKYVDGRVHRAVLTPSKVDVVSQAPAEPKLVAAVENKTSADLSSKKTTEHKTPSVKSKKAVEPVIANNLAAVNISDAPDEVHEDPVKSREEIEFDWKAEELRKQEAEAKLKEQRRLEGLAKANEARERKKRQAEKIQQRAELKARKEAEEKEKEREKRLRKKEMKKACATDSVYGNNNSEAAPSSKSANEATREIDAKHVASVVPKKPQKYAKQAKVKSSIPPPLRNKNRRKWQHYLYLSAAAIIILALFYVGNISVFQNRNLKKPNPTNPFY